MEEAARLLAELLSKRGYEVSLQLGDSPVLSVRRGSLTVCVALAGRPSSLEKLYIKPGCGSGVTIVSCEDVARVCDCVEGLIRILEIETGTA